MTAPEPNQETLYQRTQRELGFTDEQNTITLYDPEADHPINPEREYKIFDTDYNGNLTILVYGIDQTVIKYTRKGSGKTGLINAKEIILRATRLKEPLQRNDGTTQKYVFVKGQPTYPFFPPQLCKKYADKTKIQTLVLTEGYKKAFKGALCGLDIVGLGSITHWRDKETGELHTDIKKLIAACKPDQVLYLCDGDCVNISSKEITDYIDLAKRPKTFLSTVNTFHELFSKTEYLEIEKYFGHILTDEIEAETKIHAKGLDDLYCAFPEKAAAITEAVVDFGRKSDTSKYQNDYILKIKVSNHTNTVRKHFCLHDVNDFYARIVEKRPELKNNDFIFYGSKYRFDEKEGKCVIMVPSATRDYKRIGTQYYKVFSKPSIDGSFSMVLEAWNKETIKDDCKRNKLPADNFLHNIEALNGFCIIPDHFNYQPVVHNCYNLYFPLTKEVEKGENGTEDDFPVTMEFLKHIFGRGEITFYNDHTKKTETIRQVDLGLDYLKQLLCNPTQILPILCLVSKERQTGKTTFFDWEKRIFNENMAQVGNDDFKNEFNKYWSSKLIVSCDETKIDKHEVVEKLKRLATARRSVMNSKGKDQMEQDMFCKFQLGSNNEDSFLPIDSDEIRFWVIKVPELEKKNTEIVEEMDEEIPAFLHYLKTREMATPKMERHWFQTTLLQTDALKKLVANSVPTVEKEIRVKLRDMFEDMDLEQIKMTKAEIKEYLLGKKYEENYIEHILERRMGFTKSTSSEYFKYPYWKTEHDDETKIEKTYVAYKGRTGRYYTFLKKDFCPTAPGLNGAAVAVEAEEVKEDDLPF